VYFFLRKNSQIRKSDDRNRNLENKKISYSYRQKKIEKNVINTKEEETSKKDNSIMISEGNQKKNKMIIFSNFLRNMFSFH